MDALTTFERLRPDDEFLDDDAFERIWTRAMLPTPTEAQLLEPLVASPAQRSLAIARKSGPRHRGHRPSVGIAASLLMVVAGLTALQLTRSSSPAGEQSQPPASTETAQISQGSDATGGIVGLILPTLPDGLALVQPVSPPTTRAEPSPYQVRMYGSAEDPTDPARMLRLEYADMRAMVIPCHSFLSLPESDGAVAYTDDQWRGAASPIAGSTTFAVSGTTGAYCVDPSGILQAGWFTGEIGVSLSAGPSVTAEQLVAFANSLAMKAQAEVEAGRPAVDLAPDPPTTDIVVLVGEDVPFVQRVTETSWVATPNGVDGVPGQLVVQSWIGADEQGLFAKRAPIDAEQVTVRGHQGYRWAPPQRSDNGPLEIEVWWEEAPGLVIAVRSSELFEPDELMTLIDQMIPATGDDFAAFTGAATAAISIPPGASLEVSPTPSRPNSEASSLANPLDLGSTGPDVLLLEQRLSGLGFYVGNIDDQFDANTEQAIWAWKKLVGGKSWQQLRDDPLKTTVDNDTWASIFEPTTVQPRRAGQAAQHHVEVYLPLQVLVVFQDDIPLLVANLLSGELDESGMPMTYCDTILADTDFSGQRIDPPEQRDVCGTSLTPGGTFSVTRAYDGRRLSVLGAMDNPVYFNRGLAVHGASEVPASPSSRGSIRVSVDASREIRAWLDAGDPLLIWGQDGREPEDYSTDEQLRSFSDVQQ